MAILDLIQHPNEYPDEIVHRVPESGWSRIHDLVVDDVVELAREQAVDEG